jgi:hypothetical protein
VDETVPRPAETSVSGLERHHSGQSSTRSVPQPNLRSVGMLASNDTDTHPRLDRVLYRDDPHPPRIVDPLRLIP